MIGVITTAIGSRPVLPVATITSDISSVRTIEDELLNRRIGPVESTKHVFMSMDRMSKKLGLDNDIMSFNTNTTELDRMITITVRFNRKTTLKKKKKKKRCGLNSQQSLSDQIRTHCLLEWMKVTVLQTGRDVCVIMVTVTQKAIKAHLLRRMRKRNLASVLGASEDQPSAKRRRTNTPKFTTYENFDELKQMKKLTTSIISYFMFSMKNCFKWVGDQQQHFIFKQNKNFDQLRCYISKLANTLPVLKKPNLVITESTDLFNYFVKKIKKEPIDSPIQKWYKNVKTQIFVDKDIGLPLLIPIFKIVLEEWMNDFTFLHQQHHALLEKSELTILSVS